MPCSQIPLVHSTEYCSTAALQPCDRAVPLDSPSIPSIPSDPNRRDRAASRRKWSGSRVNMLLGRHDGGSRCASACFSPMSSAATIHPTLSVRRFWPPGAPGARIHSCHCPKRKSRLKTAASSLSYIIMKNTLIRRARGPIRFAGLAGGRCTGKGGSIQDGRRLMKSIHDLVQTRPSSQSEPSLLPETQMTYLVQNSTFNLPSCV